jgi:hypothetical protein
MAAEGYRAGGWLGILTAGALWTPLYGGDAGIAKHIDGLVAQIKLAVPNDEADDVEEAGQQAAAPEARVSEAKAELDRLREDVTSHQHQDLPPTLVGKGKPCLLPAEVPTLIQGIKLADWMPVLVSKLLSPGRVRVGFAGLGGIGKTTSAAWVCHQAEVRAHFQLICWVTLGQNPVIEKCEQQLYRQLTGEVLSLQLPPEQRVEKIKAAMATKSLLLVLDDLWSKEHETYFNFVDGSTDSRVLVSSRVRALLEPNVDIVTIGLPSEAEAIDMLCAAAGLPHDAEVPPEAGQIARLCRCLPLSLGICGRLLAESTVNGHWAGVLDLLHSEVFSREDQDCNITDTIFSSSLRAITGPHADAVRTLFRALGLVPEDTRVPLQALCMLYEAEVVAQGGSLPKKISVLSVRKWLKMLIDRSLVLGPIERPSMHDLCLDYSVSLHKGNELREAHRCFVEILRERRPGRKLDASTGKDVAPQFGWVGHDVDNPTLLYVHDEIVYHIRHAWQPDWQADERCITWLDDFPGQVDIISVGCARFLGERTQQLAVQAEREHKYWSASVRWKAAGEANRFVNWAEAGYEENKKCASVLEQMAPEESPRKIDRALLLAMTCLAIIVKWNPDDYVVYHPKLTALLREFPRLVDALDPMSTYKMAMVTDMNPALLATMDGKSGNEENFGRVMYEKLVSFAFEQADSLPVGSEGRGIWLGMAQMPIFVGFDMGARSAVGHLDWLYRMYGDRGCRLVEAANAYNYKRDHLVLDDALTFDPMISQSYSLPLILRWGAIDDANHCMDLCMSNLQSMISDPTSDGNMDVLWASCHLPQLLYLLGRTGEISPLFESMGLHWSTSQSTLERWATLNPWLRGNAPGSTGGYCGVQTLWWQYRCMVVLATADEAKAAEMLAEMPCPDALAALGQLTPTHHHAHLAAHASPLWSALVHERFGTAADALLFCAKALDSDSTAGGDSTVWIHCLAHCCVGRVLASQRGRARDAAGAFEAAATAARSLKYVFLEAVALRELTVHVLGPEGRRAEGLQRVRVHTEQLVGPKGSLGHLPLLGADFV